MREFHISDILTVTTGRLVSSRHMEGLYEVLNYLTDDNLFTHQLPRAARECEAVLREQFPRLFPEDSTMSSFLAELDRRLLAAKDGAGTQIVAQWVQDVTMAFELPEYLTIVAPLARGSHERIDPIAELADMTRQSVTVVTH